MKLVCLHVIVMLLAQVPMLRFDTWKMRGWSSRRNGWLWDCMHDGSLIIRAFFTSSALIRDRVRCCRNAKLSAKSGCAPELSWNGMSGTISGKAFSKACNMLHEFLLLLFLFLFFSFGCKLR